MDSERIRRLTASLQARAQPTLPHGLVAFYIAGVNVGHAQPDVARFIVDRINGFTLHGGVLTLGSATPDGSARTALLADAASKLRAAGMIPGWRDELLSVGMPPVAAIERAACRPLGITTQAVHLNAYTDAHTMFIARRAAHKQIDPGLWDNLVGGMVPADESLNEALTREAVEEAGLQLDDLVLERGRSFQVRRPVAEGLQSEIIHVFDTQLAPGQALRNEDGEVESIALRSLNEVIDAIERGEFTLEAALVTLESLTRRHCIDAPPGFFRADYETSSIHAI